MHHEIFLHFGAEFFPPLLSRIDARRNKDTQTYYALSQFACRRNVVASSFPTGFAPPTIKRIRKKEGSSETIDKVKVSAFDVELFVDAVKGIFGEKVPFRPPGIKRLLVSVWLVCPA